ncbi:MAG: Cas9 inhibitor AcrIIA9 family protein [Bacteroidales bacterium]|jgi:LDH2 family malate/lactate/ureidoglycolate dehydrogenase|nr:Cas9 inhibitor AcrIIA9 family protein [Bacteroidales bacterium]
MTASNDFKTAIQDYLKEQATKDKLFAETIEKSNKNINECVNYIVIEVKKTGNSAFSQQEIYQMAKHYYDEDDIKVGAAPKCKIVVPGAAPKRTTKPKAKKVVKVEDDNQLSLF